MALGLFRFAAILAGVGAQARQGDASSFRAAQVGCSATAVSCLSFFSMQSALQWPRLKALYSLCLPLGACKGIQQLLRRAPLPALSVQGNGQSAYFVLR